MLIVGTLVVLALWLGLIWFGDPDGFRRRSCATRSGHTHSSGM